jgi:hypothetical protein
MKPTQMDRLAVLQKGHVKLHRGEVVLPKREEGAVRMVRVDAKTVKYVKVREEALTKAGCEPIQVQRGVYDIAPEREEVAGG